jgi:rSAM/selenodomain-associated transferase 2
MIPSSGTKLKVLSRLICLGISLLGFAFVLHRIDLLSLRHALAQARLGWVFAALGIFGVAFSLAAARWHLVLSLAELNVHGGATCRTVLVGHFFNTIFFGPTGGDIAKAAVYSRWYDLPTARVLASCVLDRSLGGIGFFLFTACAPGFAAYGTHLSERFRNLIRSPRAWLVSALILLLLLAMAAARRRFHWASPFTRFSQAILTNAAALVREPRLLGRGLALAVLCHLCISGVFLFALKAVTHTPFSSAAIFWIFPVISLITSAPVTFSGAGLRESASLFFLGLYGIPAADAVAAALLVLLTYLVWAMFAAWLLWRTENQFSTLADRKAPATISIVIPTLNEALALPETLSRAREVPEITEILVIDGGSTDGTQALAEKAGCRVLLSARGRGRQLRLGAAEALGDVVLLLHADTWLVRGAGKACLRCLRDRAVVGGGFWKVFRERNLLMAGSRLRCALRFWLFGRVLGDQAMFVRRQTLEAIGGIPEVDLMEEFILCRQLRKVGHLALAGSTVTTSARRFAKLGILRTYARMAYVTARYYLGAPASKLNEIYERD